MCTVHGLTPGVVSGGQDQKCLTNPYKLNLINQLFLGNLKISKFEMSGNLQQYIAPKLSVIDLEN